MIFALAAAALAFGAPAGHVAPPWTLAARSQCRTLVAGIHCTRAARIDRHGHLNLTVRPGRAVFLHTFSYGTGHPGDPEHDAWPPRRVHWAIRAPAVFRVRALIPRHPAVWAGVWLTQVNRPARRVDELDLMEQRSSSHELLCVQHTRPAAHVPASYSRRPGNPAGWHTYKVRIGRHRTRYSIDGRHCLTAPKVQGRFGLLADAVPAPARTWAAGYGPGFTGRARVKIGRVTARRLP